MTRLKIGTSPQCHASIPFPGPRLSHRVARPDSALGSALWVKNPQQIKNKRGWQKPPALTLQTDGVVSSTRNHGISDPCILVLAMTDPYDKGCLTCGKQTSQNLKAVKTKWKLNSFFPLSWTHTVLWNRKDWCQYSHFASTGLRRCRIQKNYPASWFSSNLKPAQDFLVP